MDIDVSRSSAEGAIRVTDAEVIAAQILVRRAKRRGEQVDEATEAIANAKPSADAGRDYQSAKVNGVPATHATLPQHG